MGWTDVSSISEVTLLLLLLSCGGLPLLLIPLSIGSILMRSGLFRTSIFSFAFEVRIPLLSIQEEYESTDHFHSFHSPYSQSKMKSNLGKAAIEYQKNPHVTLVILPNISGAIPFMWSSSQVILAFRLMAVISFLLTGVPSLCLR